MFYDISAISLSCFGIFHIKTYSKYNNITYIFFFSFLNYNIFIHEKFRDIPQPKKQNNRKIKRLLHGLM